MKSLLDRTHSTGDVYYCFVSVLYAGCFFIGYEMGKEMQWDKKIIKLVEYYNYATFLNASKEEQMSV